MSKINRLIKITKNYEDGSQKLSLEIDQKEKEAFQVKIKENEHSDGLWISLKDLMWLRDAIGEAVGFLNKKEKDSKEDKKGEF